MSITIPWTEELATFFQVLAEGARHTQLWEDHWELRRTCASNPKAPESLAVERRRTEDRMKGLEGWFMGIAFAWNLDVIYHQEIVMRNIHGTFPEMGPSNLAKHRAERWGAKAVSA